MIELSDVHKTVKDLGHTAIDVPGGKIAVESYTLKHLKSGMVRVEDGDGTSIALLRDVPMMQRTLAFLLRDPE